MRKADEFRFIFENSNIDSICVSETWFQPFTNNNAVNIEGYKLYRVDRNSDKTRGGGVAIYLKNCNGKVV